MADLDYTQIPWHYVKPQHLTDYGYSGTLIKVLRIEKGLRQKDLSRRLGKRVTTIQKLESTDKIGIALAKKLARIFDLDNWRLLRNKPDNLEELIENGQSNRHDGVKKKR
jgi:transcriptional regulator with XRE-family HTH domain